MTCNKTHKVHALLKVLRVGPILLVMASGAASAIWYNSITTNPTTVVSNSTGMATFTITLNAFDIFTATLTATLTVEGDQYTIPQTVGPNNTATGTTNTIATYQKGIHNIRLTIQDGTNTFQSDNPWINIVWNP